MSTRGFDLAEGVALLARTPASLEALLDGLPDRWLHATEGEGTWSPYDVVGHLIHAERTNWIPRARHILAGEQRPFEPFDRIAQFRASEGMSLTELLTTFADVRLESLSDLEGLKLSSADLERRGVHPELGEVTLGELLATWVVHDLTHIAQVVRVMAKLHADAVGPWRAYLSILRDRT